MNYKNQFGSDIWCLTCGLYPEQQQHIIQCFVLRERVNHLIDLDNYSYNDIHGNLSEQEGIAKVYTLLMDTRKDLLDNSSSMEAQS